MPSVRGLDGRNSPVGERPRFDDDTSSPEVEEGVLMGSYWAVIKGMAPWTLATGSMPPPVDAGDDKGKDET